MKKPFRFFGSVSCGTLRTEDLLPAFFDTLENIRPAEAAMLKGEYDEAVNDPESESSAFFLNETLTDALNENLPPFVYFGTAEGDGADFGFWIDFISMEDARRDGELPSGDELPPVPLTNSWQFLVVSDHGNTTLYTWNSEKEMWEEEW